MLPYNCTIKIGLEHMRRAFVKKKINQFIYRLEDLDSDTPFPEAHRLDPFKEMMVPSKEVCQD